MKVSTAKVLFVLTSHSELGNTGRKTGFWTEEFAAPYYALTDAGVTVTIASPNGGQPPVDPKSNEPGFQTDTTRRFEGDAATKEKLANSHKITDVKEADFDAVFYPGGHGPMWDLSGDKNSIALIEQFWAKGKPVAAVCHAPAALLEVKTPSGESLLKGRKVSAFTNQEEEEVQLTKVVPFLLEDAILHKGAIFCKVDNWGHYAVQDGMLITGQNPGSSTSVAKILLEVLEKI